jgi:hypothetical protein
MRKWWKFFFMVVEIQVCREVPVNQDVSVQVAAAGATTLSKLLMIRRKKQTNSLEDC